MSDKKGITVYCGSSSGADVRYAEAARELGAAIARAGLELVYGGGHMGLMGEVGRAVIASGGKATAVIPQFMVERGWNDRSATTTIATESMHERKSTMASLARGVIALPGGVGTWEELCEIITWRQLGLFHGNIVVLNVAGYYDPWIDQFEAAIAQGFIPAAHRTLFVVTDDASKAVALASAEPSGEAPAAKF